MARYFENQHPKKEIMWDTRDGRFPYPTVAEILEAAEREFPDVPMEDLQVCGLGDLVLLMKK